MPLSHDEALLLVFHAELAGATAIPAQPQTAKETEEQRSSEQCWQPSGCSH